MERDTERLHLRPLSMADADALFPLHQDPAMQRYLGDGQVYNRDQSRTWLEWHVALWEQESYSFFAAELRSDNRFIGWLGLNKVLDDPELNGTPEVGWFIDRRYWGRGLASEGARDALRFGFDELSFDRVIARYNTDNLASGRVMQKIGMHWWREIPHANEPGATLTMYEIRSTDG